MMVSRIVKKYLIIVGVFVNLGLAGAALAASLLSDMPLALFINKAATHLVAREEVYLKTAGKILSQYSSASVNDKVNNTNQHHDINEKLLIFTANPQNEYLFQTYDAGGFPEGMKQGRFSPPLGNRNVIVRDTKNLLSSIADAMPGDVISMAPGTYRLNGRSIPVTRPGAEFNPIYIRSSELGKVTLELNMLEGFHVKAPFWVFENLVIKGVCDQDSRCEHAFHITGKGESFVLRNSEVSDFNAPVKVNGVKGKNGSLYPDGGLLEYNSFSNHWVRNTSNPVTLLNINSVNGWVVRGNLIADFAKGSGDQISYGAFMKGAGSDGVFERNLVLCEMNLPADDGVRIGLSYGGGGTGASYCRQGDCSVEHNNGVIRNNIIMNCSRDVGVYLNRAANTQVYNNLLHNNLGIDVRFDSSSATLVNNMISGRIKSRDGAVIKEYSNYVDDDCFGSDQSECGFYSIYANPDAGDFRLKALDNAVWSKGVNIDGLDNDICGNFRNGFATDLGPVQYSSGFDCLQP